MSPDSRTYGNELPLALDFAVVLLQNFQSFSSGQLTNLIVLCRDSPTTYPLDIDANIDSSIDDIDAIGFKFIIATLIVSNVIATATLTPRFLVVR